MTAKENIAQHYEQDGLIERIKAALKSEGLAEKRLSPEDLAPLDQFHSRGLVASVELARDLEINPSSRVIDIGSGVGGPSRYLASTFGCDVYGIDLSQSFVDAATFLAERSGLSERVTYLQGNALSLPFSSAYFDAAWSQHVAMNIADRARLYGETFRVLRPGGRFAIYDVVEASGQPLHYPVPWARQKESSFLVTADRMRTLLLDQGFQVVSWLDRTDAGVAWFAERARVASSTAGPAALGLHVVMGSDFGEMTRNFARNLREGRAGLVQAVVEKP